MFWNSFIIWLVFDISLIPHTPPKKCMRTLTVKKKLEQKRRKNGAFYDLACVDQLRVGWLGLGFGAWWTGGLKDGRTELQWRTAKFSTLARQVLFIFRARRRVIKQKRMKRNGKGEAGHSGTFSIYIFTLAIIL